MFGHFNEAQWVAFSFLLLGMALIAGMLLRRTVPWLAAVYIPASVIAGFLILLVGPQVLGELTNGWSLVPAETVPVLSALPGLLINVVFGGIMIGKRLPSFGRIWNDAAPHAILGSVYSFGQFAIGGLAVTFLLTPVFGLPDAAGSIIEMSFAGGHGTIAGMGGLLDEAGAGELVDIGLGLATLSMLTGVIGGTILVNWAVRKPSVDVAREQTAARSTASRLSDVPPNDGDTTTDIGLGSISRSFGAIAVAIFIGLLILLGLRAVSNALGSDLFDRFPLFPFTVIGGFVVQLVLSMTDHEDVVERRTVNDITGLSLDLLIAAAIGTLSLATLGANIPSILILTALSVAWSVTGLLWLGPRFFPAHWFERGIADYGQSQGNVATGFILAEMADPAHTTGAARGYGYKQLFYEPFLGGGILTALSVPLILSIGSLSFGIASAVVTAGLIIWGLARSRRAGLHASR
ncbi:sodium/glutamate symporter [Intrasporangium mesophilum]